MQKNLVHTSKKYQVHQTQYFKLENLENRVQIYSELARLKMIENIREKC